LGLKKFFLFVISASIFLPLPNLKAKEAVGVSGASRPRRVGAPSQTKPGNNVDVAANLLQHRHKGRFMVWNLSEETYDYAKFQDQVCFGFCDF